MKTLALLFLLLGPVLIAADAPLRPVGPSGPEAVVETDPDLLAAYANGDKIVTRLKAAEAEVLSLRAQLQTAETAAAAALQARDTALAARDKALQQIADIRALVQ